MLLTIENKLPRKLIRPLMVAVGVFYLLFHVLNGERGIIIQLELRDNDRYGKRK